MTSIYAPPWSPQYATADTHDIASGDPREWGIDVPLPAGSPVYAPFAGVDEAYQASPTDWGPGRLIIGGGPAGAQAVGFGHVVPTVKVGQAVTAGEEVGYVPAYAEGGPHTEFMLFPTGQYGSRAGAVDPRTFVSGLFKGGAGLPTGGADASGAGGTGGLTQQQFQQQFEQAFATPGPGDIVNGIVNGVGQAAAAAFAAVFTVMGHGIAGFFKGLVDNTGIFAQRQVVALAVAAVVLLVLFL